MRSLAILLLISTAPAVLKAQQPPAARESEDVSVVRFSWRKERLPGWENNPFGPSFETYDAMRARQDNERRLQQARNAGNKAEVARRERDAKVIEDASAPKDSQKTERPRDGYRYKILVRNNGAKTIKLIDWDYVFLDPETQAEVERHLFTSEEKIRPGKEKELSVLTLAAPTKIVKSNALNKGYKDKPSPFVERIVLARIEYEDGSVWQRP